MAVLAFSGLFTALIPSSVTQRKIRIWICHRLAKILVRVLKIDLWIRSPHFIQRPQAALWVANHASLLDAILLLAIRPLVFVTSRDMEEKLGLGFLARSSGCVFVERRVRTQVAHDSGALAQILNEGFTSVVFPEGTSTDGSQVLPFKRGLFRSALQALVPIQPICLQYKKLDGKKIESETDRKRVFVYGDHSILAHLIRIFTNPRLEARIHFLDPLSPTLDSRPDEFASQSYFAIHDAFHAVEPMEDRTST